VPATVRPQDYKAPHYVLTQQGAFLREFSEFHPGLQAIGKDLDLLG
jgi:hypothetical protein